MDVIAIARELAAAHPSSRLPCPVCAASLNAENVNRHLANVHAGVAPSETSAFAGKGLFGLLPCTVVVEGAAIVLRRGLGLGRRAVQLPCVIEVGALTRKQLDPIMASYAEDMNMNVAATTVRAGRYLRLVGDRSITIGCQQNTQFKAHWDRAGWREGGRRGKSDVIVDQRAFVGVEYALASRGLLSLVRPDSAR